MSIWNQAAESNNQRLLGKENQRHAWSASFKIEIFNWGYRPWCVLTTSRRGTMDLMWFRNIAINTRYKYQPQYNSSSIITMGLCDSGSIYQDSAKQTNNYIGTHFWFHMESNWSSIQFIQSNSTNQMCYIDLYHIIKLQHIIANACNHGISEVHDNKMNEQLHLHMKLSSCSLEIL